MKQAVESNKQKIEMLVQENNDLEKDNGDLTRMFKVQTEEALEKGIATNMKKSKKDKK